MNRQDFIRTTSAFAFGFQLMPRLVLGAGASAASPSANTWKLGRPIVTYWAGPGYPGGSPLDDKAAVQLTEGGWNVVWCGEKELDVAHRHGLRGLLTDPLLSLGSLADSKELDALIRRVKDHPALYAYHLIDEPSAELFPALSKLVTHLRQQDSAHLAYINLLPTYANNQQLGIPGECVPAYMEHLRQFVDVVRPQLLSYDHYQFTNSGDNEQYFLNLALVRQKSLAAGLPFLNIVQASNWVPGSAASPSAPRIPTPDEMRYLVYTTLAYGAQGISYYVYCYPKHEGGIATPDGTPTVLYHALKLLNREFVAIATEVQPLVSLGVFHTGMQPPGAVPLPGDYPFQFAPPEAAKEYRAGVPVEGLLLAAFGPTAKGAPTHVIVVNLSYKVLRELNLRGPAGMDAFDAGKRQWLPVGDTVAPLTLPKGGGRLLRIAP
jgi:hypothetical protein